MNFLCKLFTIICFNCWDVTVRFCFIAVLMLAEVLDSLKSTVLELSNIILYILGVINLLLDVLDKISKYKKFSV